MEEKIILESLTQDELLIKRQKYTIIEGKEYLIGDCSRKAYTNCIRGRAEVQAEVTEPYLNAIMAMWGTTATVTDETVTQ